MTVKGNQATAYEVAKYLHHVLCESGEAAYARLNSGHALAADDWLTQDYTDEAYVLGLMIESMPVELAEKEI